MDSSISWVEARDYGGMLGLYYKRRACLFHAATVLEIATA